MKTIVTFGEIMLRLSLSGFRRLVQARSFHLRRDSFCPSSGRVSR